MEGLRLLDEDRADGSLMSDQCVRNGPEGLKQGIIQRPIY